ncbi:MAG: hypothetical protein WKF75_19655 [Singulisphaera sp.]
MAAPLMTDWIVTIVVRMVPTQTRNITGLRTISAGLSMTNDCHVAMRIKDGSKSRSFRVWRR